jgi:hypothetical protein
MLERYGSVLPNMYQRTLPNLVKRPIIVPGVAGTCKRRDAEATP